MSFFHNESLRKKLYDYIKQKINSGALKPGDLINQKEIFEELNISRTPYRDCMIQLESEGFVRIIPCKGVVVRELSIDEGMDAQEVGAALEGMACELAFYNARERSIPKLIELIARAEKCFHDNEPIAPNLNMEFHMAILEQSPNHSLVEQLIKMRERIYDFPQHALLPLLKWEKMFWQEHRHLVEILKNGTPIEFGRYMRDVHWKVQGREEYWETLLSVRPGTVKQYFERRRAYCEQERENSL
ncbi:GntR family transcriptional regulator [Cloacibacillus evryensis]|uniref:GntR family transcriptional regulator n=1 Tax=Cloacibacillus evryensis TaxID=508460 RepID=UPI003AB310C6